VCDSYNVHKLILIGSHALYAVLKTWLQSRCRTQYVIKPCWLWSSCSAVIDCKRNLGWRVATCTLQRKLAQNDQTHTNLGRSTISPTTVKFSLYLRWDLPRKRTHKGKVLDHSVSLVYITTMAKLRPPILRMNRVGATILRNARSRLNISNTPVLSLVPTQEVWGGFAPAQTF
jgi:hypothetical protein